MDSNNSFYIDAHSPIDLSRVDFYDLIATWSYPNNGSPELAVVTKQIEILCEVTAFEYPVSSPITLTYAVGSGTSSYFV